MLSKKKYGLISLLVIIFIFATAFFALAKTEPAGKITHLNGTVSIIRVLQTIEARLQIDIFPGDEIKTGPKGLVELVLRDGSSLHIGPDSSFVLDQYQFGLAEKSPSFAARMLKGFFVYISGAISKVHPGAVKFDTPEATIGIRGTKLALVIENGNLPPAAVEENPCLDKDGKTIVILFKDPTGNVGRLAIGNTKGQTTLDKKHHTVSIQRCDTPSKPYQIDDETIKKLFPASLLPYILGDYKPGLPYTEAFRPLDELNNTVKSPDRSKPFSTSTP